MIEPKNLDYDEIARYIVGFYPAGTRVDWDDALYRVEVVFRVDLPESMTDPVITAIKKAVRAERAAQ